MSRCIMSWYFHSPSDVSPDLHRIMCCSQYGQWLGDVVVGVIIINRKYKTRNMAAFTQAFIYVGIYVHLIRGSVIVFTYYYQVTWPMLTCWWHWHMCPPCARRPGTEPEHMMQAGLLTPDMPAAHGHFPRPQPARGCVTSAGSTLCSTDRTGPLQCI